MTALSVQLLSVLVAVIMWLCASDVAEARPVQGKLLHGELDYHNRQ